MMIPVRRGMFPPVLGVLAACLLLLGSADARPNFEPVFQPRLITTIAPQAIKIDGKLDDLAWRTAGQAGNFVERSPGDNIQPLVETKALITYDADNLYVGFVCYDDPSQVRATMCQRDQFSGNDAVALMLDTYGEAAWAYEFHVNPYGVQKDYLWTNVQGEDSGFDLVWHSAGQITDSGYVVEMAIPFASMRFPDQDVQNWKVDLWRIHPRDSYHQYSWSANDRDQQCWPCQWGTVEGISGVKPGKGVEILPSFVSNQVGAYDRSSGTFENDDILGQPSLGAKYSVSSNVTLEASLNPDFSQIEADAAQIDVNTAVALFYPERRPFFQEGADLFRTLFNSFYTRMVNDPEMAVKSTARFDRTSLAFMIARDEHSPYSIPLEETGAMPVLGKSTVNVLRGLHQLGGNSQVGFMLADRRYQGGGSGSIVAGDGLVRFGRKYTLDGQFVWSLTEEPEFEDSRQWIPSESFADGRYTGALDGESYSGGALITRFRRNARNWSFMLGFDQVDGTYRTQIGFDPWNDYRNASIWTGYTFYPETGLFNRIQPQIYIDRRWNYDGNQKWRHVNFQVSSNLRWAQTFIGIGGNASQEKWNGQTYSDLWDAYVDFFTRPADYLGFDFHVGYGPTPAIFAGAEGNERSYRLGMDIKPLDRLTLEPSLRYVKSTEVNTGHVLYRQMIVRNRLQLQMNPQLSVRLVVQYNDGAERWEVDPLITYRLSSFSVFYLGSTYDYNEFIYPENQRDWTLTQRQFFMKIQYLFQM